MISVFGFYRGEFMDSFRFGTIRWTFVDRCHRRRIFFQCNNPISVIYGISMTSNTICTVNVSISQNRNPEQFFCVTYCIFFVVVVDVFMFYTFHSFAVLRWNSFFVGGETQRSLHNACAYELTVIMTHNCEKLMNLFYLPQCSNAHEINRRHISHRPACRASSWYLIGLPFKH